MTWPKKHKYGAKRTLYNLRWYASKLEAEYAAHLDSLKSAAKLSERVSRWESQIPLPLIVCGSKIGTFVCDYLVHYADGRKVYVEVKGYPTPVWRLKEKLFRALYPDLTLIVVGSGMRERTSKPRRTTARRRK